jgi:hypothetical protein
MSPLLLGNHAGASETTISPVNSRRNPNDVHNSGTTWSGTFSFSSQVHMRAYLKGSDSPFYTTKTDDSKKKAGITCMTSFERAWIEAR